MAEKEDVKNIKTEVFQDVWSTIDTIVNYATNNSIDLIVAGTRGRTGLQKVVIDSVASGIIQYSHCTVLLVR